MAIRVVATGGTIASLADPETGAVSPAVSAEDLVRGVPGLADLGPIAVEEVDKVNGWNVTPATMLEVARRVSAALADDAVDGVVVTHGTDTVEETAFLCDVTVASEKPVVFAAAMRSGDEVAADGPRNLLCAARVAADPAARGLGALLVLNDEIHAARWARKQNSRLASAFASPGRGAIGAVTPTLPVRIAMPAPRRFTVPLPAALDRPVPIVQTYTGIEEGLIEAVLEATGAAGLVLEGTGLGNVPGSAEPGIRAALERGLPVVVATRVPTGGTGPVYEGPGGGVTLRELGVVEARSLSAAKARLLLMLLAAGGGDAAAVRDELARGASALEAW
ncbi:MAG: asparaginase [Actinobacteria bacterium]|nr:asparaginase [Actinomycetota bacterium]